MNNLEFQNQLLDLTERGHTLLTESERLAHQLVWRFRSRQSESGMSGWETPPIRTLNQWLERIWEGLWPEAWPASPFLRWRVLGRCVSESMPPEPLVWDIPLILALDESFEHCLRYGLDPGQGEPANRLVEWRRGLWKTFRENLQKEGFFHPASLPERLCSMLDRYSGLIPQRLAVAGFEFAGYWEKALFERLRSTSDVSFYPLPMGRLKPRQGVYADPEQEIYGMLENLTAAASRFPLHELGVVVLDSDLYCPLIARYFGDLFGPSLQGDQAAYNLFPDQSLAGQSLFQAAFLPLDFANEGQSRLLLLGLLRSPYYGYLAQWSRALSQWDWVWRRAKIESGLERLLGALDPSQLELLPQRGGELLQGLAPLLRERYQSGGEWLGELRAFWERMGFPVLANERDQIVWQRLQEMMEGFQRAFGSSRMKRSELSAWLRAAAEKVRVQETGYENAGFQVLGSLEVRGLAFQRLYVPGLVSGALPQPVRSLPFLSPQERKRVQGGNAEGQFDFARHLFAHFRAVAPELVLSRPMMNAKGEPCLPSPFWNEDEEQRIDPVVPWRHDLPALQRAGWVREGRLGLSASSEDARPPFLCAGASHLPGGALPGEEAQRDAGSEIPLSLYLIEGLEVPEEISVSMLEVLLSCSSRFFFQEILKLEPLPDVKRGLEPSLRGAKVHEVLAVFGRSIARDSRLSGFSLQDLWGRLKSFVEEALSPYLSMPLWNVEMKRLLGAEGDDHGLLAQWLQREMSRFEKGWQWMALETAFSGLRARESSITLKGRLDRLDFHPQEGLICWDYKTGRVPASKEVWENLKAPQLPAYMLALRKGLVDNAPKDFAHLGAGYIDLRSARYLKHSLCIDVPEDATDAFLGRWEEHVAAVLLGLEGGDLSPCWTDASCDGPCSYECLCGLHLCKA